MFINNNSKESNSYKVFLLETIVSIFFFVIFVAVTTKVFISAYENNKKSIELNNATQYAQDVIETFTANNGDIQKTIKDCGFEYSENSFYILLDEQMNKNIDVYKYKAFVDFKENKVDSGNLIKLNINITSKDNKKIYSLSNDIYISK